MAPKVTTKMIHLDCIVRNPHNPRREVGDVGELARSIQELGLLQSLLVRPIDGRRYMLEAGERRWTAMRLGTDFTEAECRVLEPPEGMQPGQHSLLVGLVENTHREDLNPIERARGYQRLRDEYGMTQQAIAKAQGITDATVNHYLALMELDFKSQERVIRGTVTVSDAVKAVRAHRRSQRLRQGKKPASVFWEPLHFTDKHPLHVVAAALCDARGHTNRRRPGKTTDFKGACEQCWEDAIRQDERTAIKVQSVAAGQAIPFLAPAAQATAEGVRTGGNHRS